jgi:hypothetical protein
MSTERCIGVLKGVRVRLISSVDEALLHRQLKDVLGASLLSAESTQYADLVVARNVATPGFIVSRAELRQGILFMCYACCEHPSTHAFSLEARPQAQWW